MADPETTPGSEPAISPELLAILVCPQGRAPLRQEGDRLICTRCGPAFRINDGVPEMLIETAELPEGITAIDELPCVREASGDAAAESGSE